MGICVRYRLQTCNGEGGVQAARVQCVSVLICVLYQSGLLACRPTATGTLLTFLWCCFQKHSHLWVDRVLFSTAHSHSVYSIWLSFDRVTHEYHLVHCSKYYLSHLSTLPYDSHFQIDLVSWHWCMSGHHYTNQKMFMMVSLIGHDQSHNTI